MKGLEDSEMQRYKKMTMNSLSTQPVVPYLSSDIPNVSLFYPQKIKLVNYEKKKERKGKEKGREGGKINGK